MNVIKGVRVTAMTSPAHGRTFIIWLCFRTEVEGGQASPFSFTSVVDAPTGLLVESCFVGKQQRYFFFSELPNALRNLKISTPLIGMHDAFLSKPIAIIHTQKPQGKGTN